MFDMKQDDSMNPGDESAMLSRLMESLDIFISVKLKPKQPSKVRTTTFRQVAVIVDQLEVYVRVDVVKDIAISAGRSRVRFPSRSNRTRYCQRLATTATFPRSYVVQA